MTRHPLHGLALGAILALSPSPAAQRAGVPPPGTAPGTLPGGGLVTATPDTGWDKKAPLQQARQETGGARIGDTVYVVGGLRSTVSSYVALNTVEAYDLVQDQWRFVAPLPKPRDHMAVVSHGGRLHVFGGYNANFIAKARHWVYAPETNAWSTLASLPDARGAGWAVSVGDKIYHFGGTDSADATTNSTLIYDAPTDTWSSGAPMPTKRLHLVACAIGRYVYCIGGRRQNLVLNDAFDVNERYDTLTDTWQTLAPMPTPRSAMGMAVVNGRIHVMGGESPVLFDDHEVYDPARDTWRTLSSMRVPRHAPAAVAIDGGILVAGGATRPSLGETAFVNFYRPGPWRYALESSPVPTILPAPLPLPGLRLPLLRR